MIPFRTGFGYDVHKLVEGRKMIIGGIEIPFEKGPLAHSDGDVLLHAICDALLGAATLGDIGTHFPDTDPKYKDANSKIFLAEISKMISERNYKIANVDSTVVLEKPKLKAYTPKMKTVIAGLLNIDEEAVSIKATTSEAMGFIGTGEGIKAYASVLIYRKEINF
ncbi:MAG: 2-C-methyl-D-erythritol 2,4-cyclodiphosphate synthase [Melioribacteraceae bacterium]|nr:2-C-methyl-D-erythritol 2,4-cyclodiphosphate synthase [Melioribacteraceae bacterium]MDD3559342.1 2-C-methyl-D-erythritol 2,4-cyclodiphosphate synthase [Melioribacteraceae bacterium]